MDNISLKKVWQDDNIIELKISANSKYVCAYQNCYIEDTSLKRISDELLGYINKYNSECYLEFGSKVGNYTPAFSMRILPADIYGHVKIEVDIEIEDNDTRSHRCCFYVESELGLVEQLGKSLKDLIPARIGEEKSLYNLD